VLVSLPLFFSLLFVVLFSGLLHNLEADLTRQSHQRAISRLSNSLLNQLIRAQQTINDYNLTKDPSLKSRLSITAQELNSEIDNLHKLGAQETGEPEQLQRIGKLSQHGLSLVEQANSNLGSESKQNQRRLYDDLQLVTADLAESAANQSAQLEDTQMLKAKDLSFWLLTGIIASVLAIFVVTYMFGRRISKRLDVLSRNAINLSQDQPLEAVLGGSDEISELDKVFHTMADSLGELRQKERALVENVTDVICTIDLSGTITKMNHASLQVLGYLPEELVGKRYQELIANEDQVETVQQLRKMGRSKLQENFENKTRHKNGAVINILWSGHWSELEHSFYFVAHDITKRKQQEELLKQSEAKVRGILESMPIGIIMIDAQDAITFVNPPIERMFNVRAAEIIGSSPFSLFASHPNREPQESFSELVTRASGPGHEWGAVRPEGEKFDAELTAQDPSTRTDIGLVIAIVDVTAAHEVQRMKQELISIVSHELRSPLTSIKGFLSLLIEGVYGELSVKLIDRARRADANTQRLMRLVNDLLLIEKLESGIMSIEKSAIAFSSVLQQALDSLRDFANSHQVKLEAESIEEQLFADGDRLTQVMINLISNAIKYSESGQSVSITCAEAPGWFEVRVTDQGRGIPLSARQRIFERFQQVETDDSKRKGGTGLGLAICKAIIEQHGGTIGVDSELGKGSAFWFRLPTAKENDESEPSQSQSAVATRSN